MIIIIIKVLQMQNILRFLLFLTIFYSAQAHLLQYKEDHHKPRNAADAQSSLHDEWKRDDEIGEKTARRAFFSKTGGIQRHSSIENEVANSEKNRPNPINDQDWPEDDQHPPPASVEAEQGNHDDSVVQSANPEHQSSKISEQKIFSDEEQKIHANPHEQHSLKNAKNLHSNSEQRQSEMSEQQMVTGSISATDMQVHNPRHRGEIAQPEQLFPRSSTDQLSQGHPSEDALAFDVEPDAADEIHGIVPTALHPFPSDVSPDVVHRAAADEFATSDSSVAAAAFTQKEASASTSSEGVHKMLREVADIAARIQAVPSALDSSARLRAAVASVWSAAISLRLVADGNADKGAASAKEEPRHVLGDEGGGSIAGAARDGRDMDSLAIATDSGRKAPNSMHAGKISGPGVAPDHGGDEPGRGAVEPSRAGSEPASPRLADGPADTHEGRRPDPGLDDDTAVRSRPEREPRDAEHSDRGEQGGHNFPSNERQPGGPFGGEAATRRAAGSWPSPGNTS